MVNIIRLKNASFYAYHGAMQEEQNIGGKFEADVDMYTDFTRAAETDDLARTINYDEVYKFINKIVHEKKYYLIEALAATIADSLLEHYPAIMKVAVRVRKNNAPVGGLVDSVEAEVIKTSNE